MYARNMKERITFLKKSLAQNIFGEVIETYTEIGSGWAAIKFKSIDSKDGEKQSSITYQVTLQKPVPKFHRLIWRGRQYVLKSGMMIEGDYHTINVLIQAVDKGK